MLCRILKRIVEKGHTDGLGEKVDVFYSLGKLTADEYNELTGMLSNGFTRLEEFEASTIGGKDGNK